MHPIRLLTSILVGAALVLMVLAQTPAPDPAQLSQHRNLGKAFYENPTTQKQAVDEFRKALDLNPGSTRERLNYGLSLLKAGETDSGIAELQAVQRQDPSLPHSWFNLGIAYKMQQRTTEAIEQFC